MKTSLKSLIAVAVISAGFAGSASAMIAQGELNQAVSSALSGGSNVLVVVNGETAILTGTVADAGDFNAAEAAAGKFLGIDRVINHTVRSN